ncbi:hypothetical protein DBIPINDM_008031 (plasmid) [Mesorhizobium sp. AR02]|uniref:hypothetical protein n=1 Tax=Mesorhizobium sp. AR02 TaxID=2865837 RepID=UPI00215E7EF8|nr:hypothetical protein [Mesorhizobium sp. AR02]UVK49908.1 hypothetical protein DBIPINDM_008031 [Mesorhizobium sp. AR02]
MVAGVCKIKDGWATQDSVWIRYGDGKELEIPASEYEAKGYQPEIDDLPACPPNKGSTNANRT